MKLSLPPSRSGTRYHSRRTQNNYDVTGRSKHHCLSRTRTYWDYDIINELYAQKNPSTPPRLPWNSSSNAGSTLPYGTVHYQYGSRDATIQKVGRRSIFIHRDRQINLL
mmetsp:Transcript_32428/g.39458  ORF Transcript_32428/g.39458 Transcript_32428/m.39458 type:complete len:109 (-) Transcript_32428:691-1017(-)